MQLSNTSLEWFIVKYHNAKCSRYNITVAWTNVDLSLERSTGTYPNTPGIDQEMYSNIIFSKSQPIYQGTNVLLEEVVSSAAEQGCTFFRPVDYSTPHFGLNSTHCGDVIMRAIASQIASLTSVSSTVSLRADKKNIKAPSHWRLCR